MNARTETESFELESRLVKNDAMGLPAGLLWVGVGFTLRGKPTQSRRFFVVSTKITIDEHRPTRTRTEVYDGGNLVIDFDESNRLYGLDLMADFSAERFPETVALFHNPNTPKLIRVAIMTAVQAWAEIAAAAQLAQKKDELEERMKIEQWQLVANP